MSGERSHMGNARQPLHPQLIAILVGLVGAGALLTLGFRLDFNWLTVEGMQSAIAQAGIFGPLLYVIALAISVVVSYIPGVPLAIAAGAIWGPMVAGIYTVVGGFIGSAIAYGLGRWLGPAALKWVTGKEHLFDTSQGELAIGLTIFATRLLPIFSFDAISYGAGVAGLSWPTYASATLFGMIPSTFAITYAGATVQMNWQMAVGYAIAFGTVLAGSAWVLSRSNATAKLQLSSEGKC
ncbi:MAG: TVP38/TMEM64 family protein [Cyanobacteria bacterium J06642_2]